MSGGRWRPSGERDQDKSALARRQDCCCCRRRSSRRFTFSCDASDASDACKKRWPEAAAAIDFDEASRKREGSDELPAAAGPTHSSSAALSARARLWPQRGARFRAAVAASQAHYLNRLISFSGIIGAGAAATILLLLLLLQLPLGKVEAAASLAARKPAPPASVSLFDDDLIEGRLDTSQLCGTRYPVGPFRQLRLAAADDDADESNASGASGHSEARRRPEATSAQQRSEHALHSTAEANDIKGDELANERNLLYIVGGDQVDEGQFWPWSVAIYELDPLNGRRGFICSGSLISDKFILTAAHCIQQSRFDILAPEEISLKIASTRLDDERAHFYPVERIFVHPEYTVERKTNDIALLKLRANQRLPLRARPICLPSQVANRVDFTDQPATIIGWGKTSAMQGNEPSRLIELAGPANAMSFIRPPKELNQSSSSSSSSSEPELLARHQNGNNQPAAGHETNDTLLQAEVRVTSTDQCNRNYSRLEISWLNIDEHFLCASDPQGKRDACQGDSGGPLMWNKQQALFSGAAPLPLGSPLNSKAIDAFSDGPTDENETSGQEKWYQLGLVSFGYGCANQQYPGVYTRISYYMPWILRTVKSAGRH